MAATVKAGKGRNNNLKRPPMVVDVSERSEPEAAMFAGLERMRVATLEADPRAFDVYRRYLDSDVLFSQFDMALVQYAFFGSFIMHPEKFGSRLTIDFRHMSRC